MPVEDPKALAQEYLAKHSIGQIFEVRPLTTLPAAQSAVRLSEMASAQNLQAHVLIDRPENVREYMIEYLTNLKKVRAAQPVARVAEPFAWRAAHPPRAVLRCQDEEGQFDPELVPSSVGAPCNRTQPRLDV